MKIVLAPDKFKGCLSAADVCRAIAAGLRRVDATIDIDACPMADGCAIAEGCVCPIADGCASLVIEGCGCAVGAAWL